MKLTIIPSDGVVLINGRALKIDLAKFPQLAGIHSVQWDGVKGHVEYDNSAIEVPEDFRHNVEIASVEAYQPIIDAWTEAANLIDNQPPAVPPTIDQIYDSVIQNERVLKAIVLALNDGSLPVGTNKTPAQLKAIIKAKM